MNLFAWSGVFVVIACMVTGGIVYFTNRASRVNQLWALFCLAVSLWGFGALLVGITADPEVAHVWWRLSHVGVILIPAFFYHFVAVFANLRRQALLRLTYLVAAAFLFADATPFFIGPMRLVFGQFYYHASVNPFYIAFVVWFVAMSILSLAELWRSLPYARTREQALLTRWLAIGMVIAYAGGSTCFLPVFGVNLYPYGNFALPLFPLIMAYAFLRHRLMDVGLAAAKTAAFLLTYAVVVGVPLVVGARYQALWRMVLGDWWWAAPVVIMGLLASASPIVSLTLVRRLEQRLWQDQRRYHRTLVTASSGMTRIKDIQRLSRLIVHMVNRTVGLTNSLIFLYEPQEQRYVLRAARYPSLIRSEQAVAQNDPLITLLQEEKDLIVLDELQHEVRGGHSDNRQQLVSWVYAWMRKLEAALIVPSFSSDRLLAFLVLGAKHTGAPYTTDDISLFSALANQAALGIENAMFFEELRTNEAYMIQSEKLASLGQLASGMAHEIHNPLTIISGEAQLYLERFKGQQPQVDQVLLSIIEECKRAADITRRILRFAKPAPSDLAAISVKTILNETLTLAGYQVRMDRFQCAVNVPESLPQVRGNQNQLQEVFLNLILNACQAMGDKGGSLKLSAAAEDSLVAVRVEDNGPGIPASAQRKVFDPFYTTKPTGTGLGLFVSQRIVKAHGGTMVLDSEEGKGTCFTIRLPMWKEAAAPAAASAESAPPLPKQDLSGKVEAT